MKLNTLKKIFISGLLLSFAIPFTSFGFEVLEEGSKEVFVLNEEGITLADTFEYVVIDVRAGNVFNCDAHIDQATVCEWERYYFESGAYPTIKAYIQSGFYPLFLSNQDVTELNWFDEEINDADLTSGILVLYKGLDSRERRESEAFLIALNYLDN